VNATNSIKWRRIRGGGGPLYEGYCQETGVTFSIIHSKTPGFDYAVTAHDREGRSLGRLGDYKSISGAKRCAKVFGAWSR
jgi:hypothetical protein